MGRSQAVAEFANKRVQFASIYVELECRLPVRILQEDYRVLEFGPDGLPSLEAGLRVHSALAKSVDFSVLLGAGFDRDDLVAAEDVRTLDAARWTPASWLRREILVVCRLSHLAGPQSPGS
ncbi:MAG: hypothetical protein ACRBN8_24175 [Nannocystales bacterium]